MKATAINVALLCVSLTLTATLAEITIRIISPQWLEFRMQVMSAGSENSNSKFEVGTDQEWKAISRDNHFLKFVPNQIFPIFHEEYQNKATIDGDGARWNGFNGDTSIKWPILGDSFTFGIGVEDRQTFVSLLSNKVNANFVNLGTPGSTLPNHLDIIEGRHDELGNPQAYFFAVFLGNDLTDMLTLLDHANPHSAENRNAVLWRINAMTHDLAILRNSYLAQYVKHYFLSWQNSDQLNNAEPIFQLSKSNSPVLADAARLLDVHLTRLKTLSQELNFQPYFLLIPERNQVDPVRFETTLGYYSLIATNIDILTVNRIYAEKITKMGWKYYDTTSCFRAYKLPAALYYVKDGHLTSVGHEELARCALDFMQEAVSH